MSRRRAALALALAVGAACGGGDRPGPQAPGPASGGGAHGAALALTLPALDGGEVELVALRGKVVVLHVFTTWSLAAQAEVEALTTADADPGVVVIGVALDPEGRALVAPWRSGSGARYLIALADAAVRGGTSPLGRLSTVPTTLVLDRAGRVHARVERALAPGELAALVAAAR